MKSNDSPVIKKKREFPHVFIILMAVTLVCAVLTYVVPAGAYENTVIDGAETVVPDSYHSVEQNPVTLMGLASSIPLGLESSASIIFFIFIIAGSFNVVQETGAIEAGLCRLTNLRGKVSGLLIPIIMFAFALGGSCIGMCEETLIFIPIMITLAMALGYDSMTGLAMVIVGAMAGFTAAFMNPFNVGVAQGIAGLPTFSGMGLRIVLFSITTITSILYVLRYARKVKKDPKISPMHEFDKTRTDSIDLSEIKPLTTRHKIVLLLVVATIALIVFGVVKYKWYLTEISAVFLSLGILSAVIGGMGFNGYAKSLARGMTSVTEGAIIVGFAKAILVVLEEGNIIGTILYGASSFLSGLPAIVTAEGMYVFQSLLSIFIPSGSGQAAVTIPIMAPLADLVGVSRQTMVLGFQMADGLFEMLSPTSGWFMAALTLAKVPWIKWLKWVSPLIIGWFILGAIFVAYAQLTNYGPF